MGLISRVSSRTYRSQFIRTKPIMIIPTDDRLKIWRTLFQEGVMVAKKDTRSTHDDIKVRNLYVMKALQSLKSKGFVKENYTWQHYHWALTDEGITYLREQLSLPENVMPNTLKRTQEPQARPDRRPNKVGEGRPVTETETVTDETKTVVPIKLVMPVPVTKPSNTKVDTAEVNQQAWNKFCLKISHILICQYFNMLITTKNHNCVTSIDF